MKVCMLTSSYPRYAGDIAGTFIQALASKLVELGHEIHVVAPDDETVGVSSEQTVAGVVEHRFRYAPLRCMRVLGYARSLEADRRLRSSTYLAIGPYLLSAHATLTKLTERLGVDIIHAHWVLPNGPVARRVAQVTGRPLITSLHGSDVYLAERNRWFSKAARYALKGSDWVTACSGNLRDRAVRIGATASNSVVIPYGVDMDRFTVRQPQANVLRRSFGVSEGELVILALGRFVHKKGFQDLIAALPSIVDAVPGVKLILAGDGDLRKHYLDQIHSLGVEASVLLPGRVASDDVPGIMAIADVFVMPSITDSEGNVDGLPNVVLEAMAAGKPVVATRVGGLSELIEHGKTGMLVPERSPQCLSREIIKLLSDPEARENVGNRGSEHVRKNYNWASAARAFVDLYQHAVEGHRSGLSS